jgi:hypothetical protein
MLEHFMIHNYKNVFHVQMVVFHVKIVMIVNNVDQIISFIKLVDFVLKFVVIIKDILRHVMMVTILMVMDVVEIVKFKWDFYVMEVHQILKMFVLNQFQNKLTFKIEDNQDYLEKLY